MERALRGLRLSLVVGTRVVVPAVVAACSAGPSRLADATADAARIDRVKHVVVIYAENHSFDNMYGLFPGANGVSRATPEQMTQLDHDGKPLAELIVFGSDGKPEPRFPRMPNRPFRIDAPPVNRPPTQILPSPIPAFFRNPAPTHGRRTH